MVLSTENAIGRYLKSIFMNSSRLRREPVGTWAMGLLILAVSFSLPAFFSACHGKDDGRTFSRIPSESSNDDDTGQSPDYNLCLSAFDYISSQCGAQFYDGDGGLMTQNDLLEACGRPKVACVVNCYSTDRACAAIKSCMKGACGL